MGRTFWKGAAGWWELEIVRQVEIKMRKKWHGVGWTGERILWFNSTKLHAGVRTPEEKEQSDDAKEKEESCHQLGRSIGSSLHLWCWDVFEIVAGFGADGVASQPAHPPSVKWWDRRLVK